MTFVLRVRGRLPKLQVEDMFVQFYRIVTQIF